MILIHCALLSEAISIIEKYRLKQQDGKLKVYINDNIVLVVSGIGKGNTTQALNVIFNKYKITKALNIGIAGCENKDIKIGELFCTNKKLKDIKYMNLKTVLEPKKQTTNFKVDTLYDMEGKYFNDIVLQYLSKEKIFIFKIVSDYLDKKFLSKEFVKQLIYKERDNIIKWI